MESFTFLSPTKFVFGVDTENAVGELVASYGGSKVLIVYGGGSVVRSGLLDRVQKSLTASNISFFSISGVQPNPLDTKVYEGIQLCRKEGIDFLLPVGGGSVIDTAKAIGMGACYDGDFWDFYSGKAVAEKTLPLGTVLTIAAAGSEGSESSVITKSEGMYKRGCSNEIIRPLFSVLNPALTATLPKEQTAAGAADIFAHIMERYFTNTKEVEVTDRLCEGLMLTLLHEVPRALVDPENVDVRANILWAGMVAHNNIVGVGREQDWASHGLEHELSAKYSVAHGAGLAIIFPAWMKYTYEHDVMRFAQWANRVFGIALDFANPKATALAGIHALENYFASCGLPVRMSEIGGKAEDIDYLVEHLQLNGGTTGSFVKLDANACAEIYRISL